MADFQIEFFSNSLIRPVTFKMFIPNDPRIDSFSNQDADPYQKRRTQTLFILHGYTGASEKWNIEELAQKYNFAMVMPSGENAFYLDGISTGHKFGTFIGSELVEYVRKTFGLAMSAEETAICGLSMGGFGALHTAFAYPENFGKVGAMSSALIIHDIAHMKQNDNDDTTVNAVANYEYYRECFGDLETVEERDTNPEVLIRKLKAENKKIPKIYMCCGTNDFLLENNRHMHRFLESENIPHIYKESSGRHDMIFWNTYAPKIAEWMFK